MPNHLRFERLVFENVISQDIRSRAEFARGQRTSQYLAYEDNEEVGFLSVDRFETDSLDICALFVLRTQRGKCIGTRLLEFAEKIAREESFPCIKLNARPMDDDIDKAKLIEWYIKRGYQRDPDIDDDMFKSLT